LQNSRALWETILPKTRLQKQLQDKSVHAMLKGVPTACDIGGKRANNGHVKWWRGYKLHLDVANGQIPISPLLTAASVYDSQVAIPLMEMSSNHVTYLSDIMDSAYDAATIRQANTDANTSRSSIQTPGRRAKRSFRSGSSRNHK